MLFNPHDVARHGFRGAEVLTSVDSFSTSAGCAPAMRVAVAQFAPEFPGHDANWETIHHLAESTDADVVVVPELISCGYMYKSRREIHPYTDSRRVLRELEPVAKRHRRVIVGGFAERAAGQLFNSAFVVGPRQTSVFRKIHLWNYERELFEPGSRPLVFSHLGHRVGVEVCYDLQFPELGSYYARLGTELLLVPMAWAEEKVSNESPLQPYTHLAIATATSHGMFVAVSNRVGRERGAVFPGQSSIVDPFGRMRHLGSRTGTLVQDLDFSFVQRAKRPNRRNDLDVDPRLRVLLPRTRGRR